MCGDSDLIPSPDIARPAVDPITPDGPAPEDNLDSLSVYFA
jgi:hypothetical protein